MNFSQLGANSLKEKAAFKKIQFFSKTNHADLFNSKSDFESSYNKVTALYNNDLSLQSSSSYGTVRQHNVSSLKSSINSSNSLLDTKSFNNYLTYSASAQNAEGHGRNNETLLSFDSFLHQYNRDKFSLSRTRFNRSSSLSTLLDEKGLLNKKGVRINKKQFANPFKYLISNRVHKKMLSSFKAHALHTTSSEFALSDRLKPLTTAVLNVTNLFTRNKLIDSKSNNLKLLPAERNTRLLAKIDLYKTSPNLNNTQTRLMAFKNLNTSLENLFSNSTGRWQNLDLASKMLNNNTLMPNAHSPVMSSNIKFYARSYDRFYKTKLKGHTPTILTGKEEMAPNHVFNSYWLHLWLHSSPKSRYLYSLGALDAKKFFYLPVCSDYAEYDFRNWQASEMLEDLFWESTYSSFSQDDYNLVLQASKEINPLTEEEERFNETEAKEGAPSFEFVASLPTSAGRYGFPLKLLFKTRFWRVEPLIHPFESLPLWLDINKDSNFLLSPFETTTRVNPLVLPIVSWGLKFHPSRLPQFGTFLKSDLFAYLKFVKLVPSPKGYLYSRKVCKTLFNMPNPQFTISDLPSQTYGLFNIIPRFSVYMDEETIRSRTSIRAAVDTVKMWGLTYACSSKKIRFYATFAEELTPNSVNATSLVSATGEFTNLRPLNGLVFLTFKSLVVSRIFDNHFAPYSELDVWTMLDVSRYYASAPLIYHPRMEYVYNVDNAANPNDKTLYLGFSRLPCTYTGTKIRVNFFDKPIAQFIGPSLPVEISPLEAEQRAKEKNLADFALSKFIFAHYGEVMCNPLNLSFCFTTNTPLLFKAPAKFTCAHWTSVFTLHPSFARGLKNGFPRLPQMLELIKGAEAMNKMSRINPVNFTPFIATHHCDYHLSGGSYIVSRGHSRATKGRCILFLWQYAFLKDVISRDGSTHLLKFFKNENIYTSAEYCTNVSSWNFPRLDFFSRSRLILGNQSLKPFLKYADYTLTLNIPNLVSPLATHLLWALPHLAGFPSPFNLKFLVSVTPSVEFPNASPINPRSQITTSCALPRTTVTDASSQTVTSCELPSRTSTKSSPQPQNMCGYSDNEELARADADERIIKMNFYDMAVYLRLFQIELTSFHLEYEVALDFSRQNLQSVLALGNLGYVPGMPSLEDVLNLHNTQVKLSNCPVFWGRPVIHDYVVYSYYMQSKPRLLTDFIKYTNRTKICMNSLGMVNSMNLRYLEFATTLLRPALWRPVTYTYLPFTYVQRLIDLSPTETVDVEGAIEYVNRLLRVHALIVMRLTTTFTMDAVTPVHSDLWRHFDGLSKIRVINKVLHCGAFPIKQIADGEALAPMLSHITAYYKPWLSDNYAYVRDARDASVLNLIPSTGFQAFGEFLDFTKSIKPLYLLNFIVLANPIDSWNLKNVSAPKWVVEKAPVDPFAGYQRTKPFISYKYWLSIAPFYRYLNVLKPCRLVQVSNPLLPFSEDIFSVTTLQRYKSFLPQNYFDYLDHRISATKVIRPLFVINLAVAKLFGLEKIVYTILFQDRNLLHMTHPLPLFSEEALVDSGLLNLKNFQPFSDETTFDAMEEPLDSLKSTAQLHLTNRKGLLSKNLNFTQPLPYTQVMDTFRPNYEDNFWGADSVDLAWTNLLLSNCGVESQDLRTSNRLKLRGTTKNAIITYNAIQKVFRTRFDEGRSNARLQDFSNSYVKHPLISDRRIRYESLLGKNREAFVVTNLYNQFLKLNNSLITDLSNTTNIYFTEIPFLLSMKSDASRYLWFDWQSKWSSLEIQPSSVSRYSLLGVPYSNKSFEYATHLGDEVNDSNDYLTKLSKARKNYLSNWAYTPYFYARVSNWHKASSFFDTLFLEPKLTNLRVLLKNSSPYWTLANMNNLSHLSSTSISGINTPGRASWKPLAGSASYTYNVSTLIDLLSKREYLYRRYYTSKGLATLLPKFVLASPNNTLLNEMKRTFPLTDPINFSSEFSREFFYQNTNFTKFILLKDFLRFNNEFLGSSLNLTGLNNYLFFYLFSTDYGTKNNKNLELYKNQYRPMRKGVSNMIRLHATGAVAMPIEIRLHILASSKDVIHSWAIPSAGIKIDCVPGYSSHRVTIFLVSGIFWGQCMEVCGRFHHWMPIIVYFMKRDLFFLWCTHFMHYSNIEHSFNMVDKQFSSKVRVASFDSTTWVHELNKIL
jgi:hypothetical protein